MAQVPDQRQLVATMFADVVGYTSLTEHDEAAAVYVQEQHRDLVPTLVGQFDGEVVDGTGYELSQSLQQLPANPKSAVILREYQRRIKHVAETVTRATILLHQKSPNSGEPKKIEASLRANDAKICKLQGLLTRDRSQIQSEIANMEADRETVRNERNMMSPQFESANQKATQYLNTLSSVLKMLHEANRQITRNLG